MKDTFFFIYGLNKDDLSSKVENILTQNNIEYIIHKYSTIINIGIGNIHTQKKTKRKERYSKKKI